MIKYFNIHFSFHIIQVDNNKILFKFHFFINMRYYFIEIIIYFKSIIFLFYNLICIL
jgi:hypothetical protein